MALIIYVKVIAIDVYL